MLAVGTVIWLASELMFFAALFAAYFNLRNHTTAKVPFMLLAGERDVEAGAVSFRFRDGTQLNGVPVDEAIVVIDEWEESRRNDSPTAETVSEALELIRKRR